MSFTIFFAVFLFSSIIMVNVLQSFKFQAVFISGYISNFIAQDMGSPFFIDQLGIKGLEDFNPDSPKAIQWINSILEGEKGKTILRGIIAGSDTKLSDLPKSDIDTNAKAQRIILPYFGPTNMIHNVIELNGNVIYESPIPGKGSFKPYPAERTHVPPDKTQNHIIDALMHYFSDSAVSTPLFSSSGKQIGSITSSLDYEYLVYIYMVLASAIVLAGLFSLFIASIVGKLLSISITKPLITLEEKIDALAKENFEVGMNKQILLKKPLREIENLAASTNNIMRRMQEYSKLLEEQKLILESQNEELESQNEELLETQQKVEEAQTMLVQSEKMASIGQLTAAITHEINTPLGAINSNVQFTEMLVNQLDKNPLVDSNSELTDIAGKLKETNSVNLLACGRVIEIIRSLKTFSKLDQAEFQEANINEGIQSVLVLTSNLWKNKITLHEEYGNLPPVKCFPGLLNQVFMNIFVNAVQAVENQGDIYIRTYEDEKYINI
ncbi:MAG: hypothetical protein FIA99_01595, partial [Ruminiclostridium sp.]|nr:hypothetical protein [Ruminiclostridium sp.]